MTGAAATRASGTSWSRRPSRDDLERLAWPAFGIAAVLAGAFIAWAGRDISYSADDLVVFVSIADGGLGELIAPYNGHFVFIPKLVMRLGNDLGFSYQAFQVFTIATIIGTCALVFAWLSARVDRVVALAPTLILLVFGSSAEHVLRGAYTVWLAVGFGVGALIALDRSTTRGDALACALLCLGVATYSFALPFVLGAAVTVLWSRGWRGLWVVVIPAGLFVAWWLYAQGEPANPQGATNLSNLLLLPSWGYQSLSTALGAVSGFDYQFSSAAPQAGPALAVIAIAAIGWRLARGATTQIVATLVVVVSFWALGAVSASALRTPTAERYLIPVVVALTLLAGAALAGSRWSRPTLWALAVMTAFGVAVNVRLLSDGGNAGRQSAESMQAELGAVQIAGAAASPEYSGDFEEGTAMEMAFATLTDSGHAPVPEYLAAVERFEPLGYSEAEIEGAAEALRVQADAVLLRLESIGLEPATSAGSGACDRIDAATGQGSAELAPGQAVTIEAAAVNADVQIRRFAATSTSVGAVPAGTTSLLAVPADESAKPWTAAIRGPGAEVCVAEE